LFAALIAAGPASARTSPARAPAAAPPGGVLVDPHPHLLAKTYTAPMIIVRHGDTLSVIARRACHHASFWPELWWANRHRVHNPDLITPGERLRVPACAPVRRGHAAAALAAIPKPPPVPAPVAAAAVSASPPPSAAAASTGIYSGSSYCQAHIIADESGGNPGAVNPTSGAGGLYQFLPSTWAALGHSGLPQNASVAEQNQAYYQQVALSGYSAWAASGGC
jgi:hypothetical protein